MFTEFVSMPINLQSRSDRPNNVLPSGPSEQSTPEMTRRIGAILLLSLPATNAILLGLAKSNKKFQKKNFNSNDENEL